MSISLVSTSYAGNNLTTGGPSTVTAPTSISSGNLLVASVSSGTSTITAPSGWTQYQVVAASGAAPQIAIYYKAATGSEPTTYVWSTSVTAQPVLVSIFNISGASTTAPFNGLFSGNSTTAAVTAGSSTGTPSVPTNLNCLPIALFSIDQLNLSNSGNPTSLTSGWTAQFLNVMQDTSNYANVSNYNGYYATFAATGPITSSTSTAVTASCTWQGSYNNNAGLEVLLFINPLTYGTLSASPSSVTISGTGTANSVQVTLTETSYTGSFTVTVPTAYQSIVSVSATQTGTYGTSCTCSGPSGSFWVQELTSGNFQINVLGG